MRADYLGINLGSTPMARDFNKGLEEMGLNSSLNSVPDLLKSKDDRLISMAATIKDLRKDAGDALLRADLKKVLQELKARVGSIEIGSDTTFAKVAEAVVNAKDHLMHDMTVVANVLKVYVTFSVAQQIGAALFRWWSNSEEQELRVREVDALTMRAAVDWKRLHFTQECSAHGYDASCLRQCSGEASTCEKGLRFKSTCPEHSRGWRQTHVGTP